MHDLKAICDALAGYYDAGAIATPSGGSAMREAYPQSLKGVPVTPCVIIQPRDGESVLESGTWVVTHKIDIVFLVAKRAGDPVRVEKQRQLWLVPLLSRTIVAGYALGLSASNVKSALPSGYDFDEFDVAGEAYDAVIIHMDVIVREPIVAVV